MHMDKAPRGFAFGWVLLAVAALASLHPSAAEARGRDYSRFGPLAVYKNARFGFSLTYPSDVFKPEPESAKGDGRLFYTDDRKAKISVFGAHNVGRYTMSEYRDTIMKEFKGYEQVTYSPKGKTWFVLSGFHDGKIYYQKVMFSCGDEVINVMAVSWPILNREQYDPVVELLEKNFHPGAGANSPADCR
jgi:hypothetical protein